MTSPLTTRLSLPSGAIRFAVSVVCCGAMLLLNVTDAFATCGDYLHSKNMRGHQHAMPSHAQPNVAHEVATSDQQPSAPMRTPCNGPQCRSRDESPLTPGPAPVKFAPRSFSEALLTPTTELNLVSRATAYHEAAVCASEGFRDPLDRPPRA